MSQALLIVGAGGNGRLPHPKPSKSRRRPRRKQRSSSARGLGAQRRGGSAASVVAGVQVQRASEAEGVEVGVVVVWVAGAAGEYAGEYPQR